LRADASLALVDARYDDFTEVIAGVLTAWDGNTPTNVPERVASLWLTWDLPQHFQLQGGLRYMSERFLNNANTATTPSVTVVDAAIRRRLTDAVSVNLRATNLFDTLYLQSVSGSPVPLRGRIGAPRHVELTFDTRF
jgi:iron complex outermembrane receptor protein